MATKPLQRIAIYFGPTRMSAPPSESLGQAVQNALHTLNLSMATGYEIETEIAGFGWCLDHCDEDDEAFAAIEDAMPNSNERRAERFGFRTRGEA